jgi:hypothetical protein
MKFAFLRSKHRNLAGLMIASVFALAACGGGGGGGDHGGGGLASGTFTRTFSPASSGGNQVPFGIGLFGDVTYQGLYTAAEVGGSGRITTLRFQNVLANPGPITCPNTTIRLGHSNLAALTATFASNTNVGTAQVVLNNATVNVPAAAGAWFDIALTTPFDYNGVDNLVVQVDRTTVCSGAAVFGVDNSSIASRRAWSAATDTTPGTAQNNTTTGAVDTEVVWMQFVFTGGDNKLDFGGVGTNTWPFDDNNALGGLRIQSLYLASEINGSGPITGIAYQANALTVAGTYSYSLKLGHSTLAALTTNYAGNYASPPTVVANAVANFTIPANVPSGGWIWVPIPDGVFTYNGTDNLIVEVSTTAGSATNSWRVTSIAGRRAANNGATAPTAAVVDAFLNHIALRFNGGPMAVITPGGMGAADLTPFYNTDGKRQFLYRAAELGTAGTISKLACRASIGGGAETGFNYTVVLSHSTAAALGGTYATNLTSPVTVFSGTLNIPATLVGDWFEIPFTTPFSYNGKDNLVVQVGGTGGTAGGAGCAVDVGNAARYTGRRVFSALSTDAVGTVSDSLLDMRFTLN